MKFYRYRTMFFFLFVYFSVSISFLDARVRGSSAPFISGDTFRDFADHIFDETTSSFNPEKVFEGDVIFIKTDWDYLERFFTQIHPKINHRYAIITHNSDHSAPGPYSRYLDSEKVIAWFAQNIENFSHLKLFNLPIGIANKCWKHGNPKVFLSSLDLRKNTDRPNLCYMNFSKSTYPLEREYVYDRFEPISWCKKSQPKNLQNYLKDLSNSKFTLSPRGNGIDTHRTWEALLMGSIPIVKSSSLDPLYKDLPVLIIDNWEYVNKINLSKVYEMMKDRSYNLDKIYAQYWVDFIQEKIHSNMRSM